MSAERTPLLRRSLSDADNYAFPRRDRHKQFCRLVGIPPSDVPAAAWQTKNHKGSTTLYERATERRRAQNFAYVATASLSNTLLMTQVVLGATLTALGASESSHVLITVFGVLNTVIAGLVAYLKSRGQPMRARMFRDDLEHVVSEIENSEIMWLGITHGAHGYEQLENDDHISVRSEVARLTRLYDRACKTYTQNNPDLYMAGSGVESKRQAGQPALPGVQPAGAAVAAAPEAAAAPSAPAAPDPDESPMTATKPPPKTPEADSKANGQADDSKKPDAPAKAATDGGPSNDASNAAKKADDPDAEPATDPSPGKSSGGKN